MTSLLGGKEEKEDCNILLQIEELSSITNRRTF